MNLEEMNGFFAALICGPVTVPPSVYLEEIWGGEGAPFGTVAEVGGVPEPGHAPLEFIARELGNSGSGLHALAL